MADSETGMSMRTESRLLMWRNQHRLRERGRYRIGRKIDHVRFIKFEGYLYLK